MRGGNQVQFWMDKLGDVLTPDMLNAMISNNGDQAFVGLGNGTWFSDAGILLLGEDCMDINGRAEFGLHLEFDSEDVIQIGEGNHDLEYWIESSLPDECI